MAYRTALVAILFVLLLTKECRACIEEEIATRSGIGEALAKIQCINSLGVRDPRTIPDTSLTASTYWHTHPYHSPQKARLDAQGCWGSDLGNEHWIQVDLGRIGIVTGIVTQGRPTNSKNRQWVTKYKVKFAVEDVDNMQFVEQDGEAEIFDGNNDFETHVTRTLEVPIVARYVRIYPQAGGPNGWCMRFDLIGC